MVRFSSYVLFMTAFSLVLYFLGAPNVVSEISNKGKAVELTCPQGDQFCRDSANSSNQSILGLMLLMIGAAGVLAGLLLGFSAIYVLAIIILIAVLNFFIFPFGIFINPAIVPNYFGYPLIFLFNVYTVLAITDFVRGGA